MRTDWITIPDRPDNFSELTNKNVISILNEKGLLEIAGPDSAKFLQGQLTCNLQDISITTSRPGAHCTHKGRMVASFRLLQRDAHSYLFSLAAQTLPALQKSLGKYIVFSKAKLRDASDDYLQIGISGASAASVVRDYFELNDTQPHTQSINENGIAICVNASPARYLCIVPADKAEHILHRLSANAYLTDNHYWQWLDIRDGIGEVRAETIEEFIPQMLNLQQKDGISFTKGCYTGQEIVARMQYRGILKKSMYRIRGEGLAPAPNEPVLSPDKNQTIGHIVQSENVSALNWEALAVIQHEFAEKDAEEKGAGGMIF